MQGLGADRYATAQSSDDGPATSAVAATTNKLVPEGIEGRVPYAGPLGETVFQLVGGLRSGMGYAGAADLEQLRTGTRFMRVTTAGREEEPPARRHHHEGSPELPAQLSGGAQLAAAGRSASTNPSGSSRLRVSSRGEIANTAIRAGTSGSIVSVTRPSDEPLTSHRPRQPCTPQPVDAPVGALDADDAVARDAHREAPAHPHPDRRVVDDDLRVRRAQTQHAEQPAIPGAVVELESTRSHGRDRTGRATGRPTARARCASMRTCSTPR